MPNADGSPALAEMLALGFPGAQWSITGDDYATLQWDAGNVAAKPTEAAIRAFHDQAVAAFTLSQRRRRQNQSFWDQRPDAQLAVIEIIVASFANLYQNLPASVRNALDPQAVQAMQTLKQKIDAARLVS